MSLSSVTSSWLYLEHLYFIFYIIFQSGLLRERGRRLDWDTDRKRVWVWKTEQARKTLQKLEGKRSWSSASQLMELPSSSGELLVICRDVSLPVERLSHHIVQWALIRQSWPPGALISIARGRGNPRQGPAGHLITATAPSSPHPYSLPSSLCPHPPALPP